MNRATIVLSITCMLALTRLYAQHRDKQYTLTPSGIAVKQLLDKARNFRKTNSDSAVHYAKQALSLSESISDGRGTAESLLCLGSYAFDREDYKMSRYYFTCAIPYCHKASREAPMLLPRLYSNLGNVMYISGREDSAIAYYYQGISLFERVPVKKQDSSEFLFLSSNLGAALVSATESKKAMPYLQEGLRLAYTYNKKQQIAQNNLNIGRIYFRSQHFDTAVVHIQKALSYYRIIHDTAGILDCLQYCGLIAGNLGKLDEAQLYFDSVIAINPVQAKSNEVLQGYMGDIHYLKKEYLQAITFYRRSLQAAAVKGTSLNQRNFAYSLSQCFWHTGNKDSAYIYLKIYSDSRDSTLDEEKIQTVNKLEIQYRVAEQQKLLAEKNLQLSQKEKAITIRNIWIICIVIGTLLLSFLTFFIFRNYRHKQHLQAANIDRLQLQKEANLLLERMRGEENERNRIARDLHDGIASILSAAKMNLSILKAYPLAEDIHTYQHGMELLDDAYKGIRLTAHNLLAPEQIMREGLFITTQRYCEKINQPGKYNIIFQSMGPKPELDAGIALFLFRSVQELLHNASRHAQASEIMVEMSADEQELKIIIEDNGMGIKETTNLKNIKGVGLYYINERIITLGGSMDIDSREGIGTTIYIIFDMAKLNTK